MNMEAGRGRISIRLKVGLITVGVFEIAIGLASIAASVTTIAFTLSQYKRCYKYYYGKAEPYPVLYQHCDGNCFNNYLYTFSLTSQGIWTGCLVIISASLNIRFAMNPTKQMGSISDGFSILSFIFTILMIILESIAVGDGYCYSVQFYYYDEKIWTLHRALLAFAAVLFTLTLTNMIISYVVTGWPECCRTPTAVVSMTCRNGAHPMTAHPATTLAIPRPISAEHQMQVGEQIPSITSSRMHQPPLPPRPPSSLLAIPEAHTYMPVNGDPTLITGMHYEIPIAQTHPSFLQEHTLVGTAVIPGQPKPNLLNDPIPLHSTTDHPPNIMLSAPTVVEPAQQQTHSASILPSHNQPLPSTSESQLFSPIVPQTETNPTVAIHHASTTLRDPSTSKTSSSVPNLSVEKHSANHLQELVSDSLQKNGEQGQKHSLVYPEMPESNTSTVLEHAKRPLSDTQQSQSNPTNKEESQATPINENEWSTSSSEHLNMLHPRAKQPRSPEVAAAVSNDGNSNLVSTSL